MSQTPLYKTINSGFSWYFFVKYLTYCLLFLNVILFFLEELTALEHTFSDNYTLFEFIQVFSATIDTGFWFFLLMLFELETSSLELNRAYYRKKTELYMLRGACYVVICYAFVGYCYELLTLYETKPLSKPVLCSSPENWSFLVSIDEYILLNPIDCQSLVEPIYRVSDFQIVATFDTLISVQHLAWIDVINSATWILIVAVLELEVAVFSKREFSRTILNMFLIIKFSLYLILFLAAIYWGVAGDFLDFWDAVLWLFAFIFIEMNVLRWGAPLSTK